MNEKVKKQLYKSYDKYGLTRINEFCALSGLELILAYETLYEYSNNEEDKKIFTDKVKMLKEFYGVD